MRRCVGVDERACGSEPRRWIDERCDAAELEPYPCLRSPLRPSVPWEKWPAGDFHEQKKEAQRDPRDEHAPHPPPGSGELVANETTQRSHPLACGHRAAPGESACGDGHDNKRNGDR